MKNTGAEIMISLLERQGIPGGANLPIYDVLGKCKAIRHVLARHEQGAGFIAQGMARVTGEPAVCFATSGPGATNIMTALADAKLDSIPVVCITGQVAKHLIGTDAFQEIDTCCMSLPATKHNYLVRSTRSHPRSFPNRGVWTARTRLGRCAQGRPTRVDRDRSVAQTRPAGSDSLRQSTGARRSGSYDRRIITADSLSRGGIIHSGATQAARRLSRHADIPVTMTLMALGAMPRDHRMSLDMLGMYGARYTNMALEECDLLIAAGARFDDRATGRLEVFCPKAKVIHFDIDPSEIHKLRTAHIAIESDVGLALEVLIDLLPRRNRPA
jgi:acetolactate synthase-1/2/3 large subunit